jgi:hypothetical protein
MQTLLAASRRSLPVTELPSRAALRRPQSSAAEGVRGTAAGQKASKAVGAGRGFLANRNYRPADCKPGDGVEVDPRLSITGRPAAMQAVLIGSQS